MLLSLRVVQSLLLEPFLWRANEPRYGKAIPDVGPISLQNALNILWFKELPLIKFTALTVVSITLLSTLGSVLVASA